MTVFNVLNVHAGSPTPEWNKGDRVLAKSRDDFFYPGAIQDVVGARYLIQFDDDTRAWVARSHLLPFDLQVGSRVFGRRQPGTDWLAAAIDQLTGNGIHLVYDDNQQEWTTLACARVQRPVAEIGPDEAVPLFLDGQIADPVLDRLGRDLMMGYWQTASDFLAPVEDANERMTVVQLVAAWAGRPRFLDAWVAAAPLNAQAWLVRGVHAVQWAWQARGGAHAGQATDRADPPFVERLQHAEKDLLQAAQLDPHDPTPHAELITVGMGLGQPAGQIEQHFQHAIARAADHCYAHWAFLQAVSPKWGGSNDQLFEFARLVLASCPEGSPLALLVASAHLEYLAAQAGALESPAALGKYFARPEVRADLDQARLKSFAHPRYRIEEHAESARLTLAFYLDRAGATALAAQWNRVAAASPVPEAPTAAVPTAPVSTRYSAGDRVLAPWQDEYLYPGTVFAVDSHGVIVHFDDGDQLIVPEAVLQPLAVQPGERIFICPAAEARLLYFPAIVLRVDGEKVDVQFEGNEVMEAHVESNLHLGRARVPRERVVLPGPTPPVLTEPPAEAGLYAVGDRVFARWLDLYWYPGTIIGLEREGLKVLYDDSDQRVLPETMLMPLVVEEGERIFIRPRGETRKSYAPARVLHVDGETLDVEFEGSEHQEARVENNLKVSRARVWRSPVGAGRWSWEEGDRVFVLNVTDGYWYPAEIVSIDEERLGVQLLFGGELFVTPELLKKLELTDGAHIECRRKGAPVYFPCVLTHQAEDKITVQYEDGVKEPTIIRLVRVKA
jgi:hypothetical protein